MASCHSPLADGITSSRHHYVKRASVTTVAGSAHPGQASGRRSKGER